MKKFSQQTTGLLVALLAMAPFGCTSRMTKARPDLPPEVPVVSVEVEATQWADTYESRVYASGIVKPKRKSELSFERIGRVDSILVSKGDRVEPGQVIARLNTDVLESQIRKMQAELLAAKSLLAELRAGPRQSSLDAARSLVDEQNAQLEAARNSFERRKRLVNSEAISREDFEQSQWNVTRLEAAKNTAQKNLDELQQGTRQEKIASQEAMVTAIQESIVALQVEIDHSQIKSPYRGTVIELLIHEGHVANPGSPAMVVSETSNLEAHFGVSPEVAGRLTMGSELQMEVRSKPVRAMLQSIIPDVDDKTRTLHMVTKIHPQDIPSVIPGDLAQLPLTITEKAGGFWISSTALLQGTRGLWECFVVEPKKNPLQDEEQLGIVSKRAVEILHTRGDQVLVRGALQNGELVVRSLPNRLISGQVVKAIGKGSR